MKWKTLVILALLAAGFGGFYLYDVQKLTPAREKAESVKGRIWTVEPKDVQELTIARPDATIRARRVEGGWELLAPVTARGDRGVLDEMVTSLVTARMDREVDANPARPADFGLAPPAAEVTLAVKDRAEPLRLSVGAKSPTGAWVYAREGGKTAVITLSESVSRDTTRSLFELRDKTLVSFERKDVTGLDLDVAGDHIELVAGDEPRWRMVKPREYRADADLVGEFLDKLAQGKAKEFVAETGERLAQYGLDRPAKATLWTGKDTARASRTLLFGRVDPDKKGVYVMRAGESVVMLAPEEVWTAFPKTVAALRDKVVFAHAAEKVNRVELVHARGSVTLQKEGSDWKVTAPDALKADPGAVNAILWRLRDLRASGFLADGAADVPRLLGQPDVTVKVWEEGAKDPKVLLLKASREIRGGQPAAVAAVEGQGPVVLVEGKALGDLSKTAADLRDRTLLPAFELSDVKRVQITISGKRVTLERKGEADWQAVEPAKGSTKDVSVTNVLLSLKTLRWKDIVSAKGDDAARFGVASPEGTVTLARADGEIATLLIGTREGDITYVQVKGTPAIHAVDSKTLDDVRKVPSQVTS
jgi:hypothetical protein